MLDDLFPGIDNYEVSYNNNQNNKENPTSLNCGSYLEKPELPRSESNFVGLFNQGGTCYMNSSLQVLFMNPLFRQIIYDLPLCIENDINKPNENFIQKGQMFDILLAIQKLFIQLNYYNIRAITTKNLTETFNWSSQEGSDQHDSQEFFNLFFETLDSIMTNTPYNGVINNLFRIVTFSSRICSNCNHTNSSEEFNLDITLNTKEMKGLYQNLENNFNNYEIINDYKCDNCKQKVDLKKINKISQLPICLNICLNKMDFDMNTYERVKLNNKYDFPLEIDMSPFVREDLKNKEENKEEKKDDFIYELYSIIVHRGTPYSGHYFAYVRDLNEEGNWNLKEINEMRSEPEKSEEVIKEIKEIENIEEIKNIVENKKQNKNTKKQNKKSSNNTNKRDKNKTNQEKEYEKLNFDECDHPLKYSNKNLSKRWFDFNDTAINPIRVGRLQKQFQSSESAYILFYMKKNVQVNNTNPPTYLLNYIQELNSDLTIKRLNYEEELKSLSVQIFDWSNFYFDKFDILSTKENITDLEKSENQINLKLKFYNTLYQFLEEILVFLKSKNNSDFKNLNIDDLVLYEIQYKKESSSVVIISKYDFTMKDINLEQLKICHNSRFILINKNNTENNFDNIIEKIDYQIGINFEPINIQLIFGEEDKLIKVFNNKEIPQFKNYVKSIFNIENDINLILKSNKNINLEKIGFDKKNNNWLNLKQLRVIEKSVIFVTKADLVDAENKNLNKIDDDNNNLNEKINCIVNLEDEEEFTIVKTRLNKTFLELIEKIQRKMNLIENNEEIIENNLDSNLENHKISIRLRKKLDGRIIYKNQYNQKLTTEEVFLDGGVRLGVEFGEPYQYHEILLKIILEFDGKKSIKEFIGDPEKTQISELKKFICEQFNLKPEEHLFYKVSALLDPIKAIKNENQNLSKISIKDNDTIFLKNISGELYETYYIKIHNDNCDDSFIFKPIDNSNFILELNLSKETTLKQLKEEIISKLNLDIKNLNYLRVRVISKKMDPDRILRGDNLPIKKFNVDNPCNLFIEILPTEENLKENNIQVYLWKRNVNDKIYYEKKNVIFEYLNNLASSDQLYELCRKETGWNNIALAKYAKFNYIWESITEMNESVPLNLRKVYNLRDGDWIGIRNEEENEKGFDDFQTNEDKKIIQIMKSIKIESSKASNIRKNKQVEKPLRIPTFN